MGSQVIGNLMAAYVLGELSQSAFVIIMAIIAVGAGVGFVFLGKPLRHTRDTFTSPNSTIRKVAVARDTHHLQSVDS